MQNFPPLLVIVVAACTGIFVDRVATVPLEIWLFLGASFWLAWLLLWLNRMNEGASLFLLASTAACFALHHHIWWRYYPPDEIAFFTAPSHPMACIRGVVVEEPRIQPAPPPNPMDLPRLFPTAVMGLRATAIRDGSRWQVVSGRITVYVQGELQGLRAGDVVQVFGLLYGPPMPQNPGETDFSTFRRTHRRLATLQVSHPAAVVKIGRASWFSPRLLLARIRGYHSQRLEETLASPYQEIATAVLLGIREGIDPNLSLAFFETNTLHLLAISGLHVGLLAAITGGMANLLFRRWRGVILAIAVCVLGYIALAETRPPVLRAGTLVLLGCLASLLGRSPLDFNLLAGTGLVVLAINPSEMFQAGTHLTFLAATAILWFHASPLAPRRPLAVRWLVAPRGRLARILLACLQVIREALLINIWVWCIVTPYVATKFHIFPLLAPIVTVVLLPILTVILATAIATLVLGWIFPIVATPFALICDLAISLFSGIVLESRRVPYSFFWVAGPPTWWTTGFYGILAFVAAIDFLRRKKRWVLLVLGWAILGVTVHFIPRSYREFRCTFVSVGHGLLTVLQPPGGPAILYDAGSIRVPEQVGPQACQVLWSLGVRRVAAIFLSHGDRDHYNLVPEIARRFPVGQVFVGPQLASALGQKVSTRGPLDPRESPQGRAITIPSGWHHLLPSFRWSGSMSIPLQIPDSQDPEISAEEENRDPEQGVRALAQFLNSAGIPIVAVCEGDTIALEGSELRLRVLSTLGTPEYGMGTLRKSAADNASSLVIAAEYAGRRILLTGDLEKPGTDRLFAKPPLPCDVVLAPHHGSRSSNPAGITEWASPIAVVISGSRQWFRGDVVAAYRQAGIAVLHTLIEGATTIEILPTEGSQDFLEQQPGKVYYRTFRTGKRLEFDSRRAGLSQSGN
jgi:competence protein ComEC